ncbi:hypothetical protein M1403_00280 [Patescibacteria group bacterium]|nr:hypothetical protein [Patescibacteria group bacterium]
MSTPDKKTETFIEGWDKLYVPPEPGSLREKFYKLWKKEPKSKEPEPQATHPDTLVPPVETPAMRNWSESSEREI